MRWLFLMITIPAFAVNASGIETITLTQTACQFVEAERGDHHYSAESYDACEKFNEATSKERLDQAVVMTLKPGEYLFRVHNRDVPYVLGFWLRGEALGRFSLPSVSGGGIETGGYREYQITLQEGEYRYSCPLNPTPDYRLVVKQ
ncbi:MAG TPA: hypothetical protein VKA23_02675 [Mariprofundaceae bacterium]|nr:hypothetical protein [Mariprofundaceae bacterium]